MDYYDIDYYVYGYFVLNDRLFNYLMDDSGYVWIASRSGVSHTDTDGYLSDDIVKGYRNKLECFRHSTKEDINKRSNYTRVRNIYSKRR